MKRPIRVFIVDDHALLRLGIIKMLGSHPARFEVVGECAFPDEALPNIHGRTLTSL
jgi:DNA-binding NarL/FixJ family response regulator